MYIHKTALCKKTKSISEITKKKKRKTEKKTNYKKRES